MDLSFASLVSWQALLILLSLSIMALILGAAVGSSCGSTRSRLQGIALTILGGFLGRGFILILLHAAHDKPGAQLAIGWGFFLWPGAVDSIGRIFGADWGFTSPAVLLGYATVIGGVVGMMGGVWRIYDWKGLGWISFPLDVTWGLGGNTNGCLLHLINIVWGKPQDEPGTECFRYASGFGIKRDYAFTQGSVMSNQPEPTGTPLFKHERVHVWQSRVLGPIYLLSYIAWMAVWVLPSFIIGAARQKPGSGPQEWCYFNNPFEAWAYAVQGQARNVFPGTEPGMIWGGAIVAGWSVPFFALVVAGSALILLKVW
jgi:hypothetical protein